MQIAFRVDGDSSIGFGHLVRSSTLARTLLKRGNEVTFITATPENAQKIGPSKANVMEISNDSVMESSRSIQSLSPDFTIFDLQNLTLDHQQQVAGNESKVGVIVDDTGRKVACDIVINEHIYASKDRYEWTGSEPEWCLGSEFFILRSEFQEYMENPAPWRDPPEVGLVLMGGSDVADFTKTAIYGFDGIDMEVQVILGPGFQDHLGVQEAIQNSTSRFTVVQDPDDLANRMFEADLAVSALGLTAYELMAMQTPIVGVPVAPDQFAKAEAMKERDLGIVLSSDARAKNVRASIDRLVDNPNERRGFRKRCSNLVGVDGVERICDKIESIK